MNEKENFNELSRSNLNWVYCPICGTKIPQVEHIKFCIKCGVDLQYINTHMRMPPRKNTTSLVSPTPSSYQPYSYGVRKPLREKITEEDLLDLQDKKLWSSGTSVGVTAIAFMIMNFIGVLGIVIFMLFSLSLEDLYIIF